MIDKNIQRELDINFDNITPRGRCVSCSNEMTAIDLVTQAVQNPSSGTYCCQICMATTAKEKAPEIFK